MILVDTSVWIDHFRTPIGELTRLLDLREVLLHPYILGELALGGLPQRGEQFRRLSQLPPAPVASHIEAMTVLQRRDLGGTGIGYVDVHLLTSAALVGAPLWTRDRRLAAVATALGLGYSERG